MPHLKPEEPRKRCGRSYPTHEGMWGLSGGEDVLRGGAVENDLGRRVVSMLAAHIGRRCREDASIALAC